MQLYNTMKRKKEDFVPLRPGRVKIYACGPTVYDYFHIGNARAFVSFDILRRYFEYRGYEVEFCQNFTDIDDRMIQRAAAENITVQELADRFIKEYYKDADKLHILRPTYQPRATRTMDEIIDMIRTLEEKGIAYEAQDGVYYDVARFPDYGCLSHMHLDELQEGAGHSTLQTQGKRNPSDFVLWKKKKEGEPSWPSPWGEGRPGWHIECSAMIKKYLGDSIDIHGGGQDLIFPHHENEIAQSVAANDAPFVRYWMHNGYITIDNEKMSKSENNFFTIRDIAEKYEHDVMRFFIASGQYRMPINFSDDLLQAASNSLSRITNAVENLRFKSRAETNDAIDPEAQRALNAAVRKTKEDFIRAMDDDLNTADAITAVFELVRAANTGAASQNTGGRLLTQAADMIVELMDVLGIPVETNKGGEDELTPEILDLVQKRTEAKTAKNFVLADAIRDDLLSKGYQVKDTPQGPQVSRV